MKARREGRLKVFRIGEAVSMAQSFRVHILDISANGARLYATAAPELGARLTLRCVTASALGEVRWVAANRFGLRFDRPLEPEQLSRLVGAD